MTKPKPKPPAPSRREPTEAERTAMTQAAARKADRPARVSVVLDNPEPRKLDISNPHSEPKGWGDHFNDTFGTRSHAFADQAFMRLANAAGDKGGTVTQDQANAALALMGAIAPKDELEAIIGEQITAAHLLAMDLMGKAQRADTVPKQEAYVNMATKLSRTMAAQVEALSRLRSGGKQQVIVKHVYINGNAVVGDHAQAVLQGGEPWGGLRNIGQAYEPQHFASANGSTLRSEDAPGNGLQVTSGSGAEEVSDSWLRPRIRSPNRRGQRSVSERSAHPGADAVPLDGPRVRPAGKGNAQ